MRRLPWRGKSPLPQRRHYGPGSFVAEARNHGAKLVVLSPDFSEVARYADRWIPVHAGMDAAFWMAVNHVILKEFHAQRSVPYFTDYLKRYSDTPFLVTLQKADDDYVPGRFLRANQISRYKKVENGDWKFLVFDAKSGETRMPLGSLGFRWQHKEGEWNLELKDGLDQTEIDPLLTLFDRRDGEVAVRFTDFGNSHTFHRGVPVKYINFTDKPRLPWRQERRRLNVDKAILVLHTLSTAASTPNAIKIGGVWTKCLFITFVHRPFHSFHHCPGSNRSYLQDSLRRCSIAVRERKRQTLASIHIRFGRLATSVVRNSS